MKSTIALIGAALMLVLADARSEDIQGWQTFTWGMTGEQIAKAAPGTGVVQQPRSSPPKAEFYVDWVMPSLALERETFRVDLRMNLNTGRLAEIVMVDTTSPALGRAPQPEAFSTLERLLTQKYGSAHLKSDVDQRRDRMLPSLSQSRTWSFPTTSIELRHDWFTTPANESVGSLTIRYFQTKASDSRKL